MLYQGFCGLQSFRKAVLKVLEKLWCFMLLNYQTRCAKFIKQNFFLVKIVIFLYVLLCMCLYLQLCFQDKLNCSLEFLNETIELSMLGHFIGTVGSSQYFIGIKCILQAKVPGHIQKEGNCQIFICIWFQSQLCSFLFSR